MQDLTALTTTLMSSSSDLSSSSLQQNRHVLLQRTMGRHSQMRKTWSLAVCGDVVFLLSQLRAAAFIFPCTVNTLLRLSPSSTDMAEISNTEKVQLHAPDLEELRGVLQTGLEDNFAEVQVNVVECPDLSKEPFQFPVKGLCGNPRITDVGGVPYLVPLVQKHKEYDMNSVSKEVELPGAFILGAAGAPSRIVGMNAELMPLCLTEAEGKPAVNSSYMSSINPADGRCLQEKYSDRFSGCSFGLLGNLYACEGKSGKVLEVRAKKRTGGHSLVTALRKTLEGHYPEKSLALGGTFIIQKGKAKIHIMPREFSACPLNTDDDVNNWLKHFEVSAPLICQSVLVSRDPGLDLRVEHTHCFSHHGEGGHYYIDTTPDSVEYLGYFMPAEFVYRIDRPVETHGVGRD